MNRPLNIVVLGLSITSSWGNGHATTYRALLQAFAALGHHVLFLERDVPWYASHRDGGEPQNCKIRLYANLAELMEEFRDVIADADAVVVGSYVPDGCAVTQWVTGVARGLKLFYDIDTPVTLTQLSNGDAEYLSRNSVSELDAYLSFTGGPTLATIEQAFGARLALPLYCSADPASYTPRPSNAEVDLGYLGTYSTDRQPTLERLLNEPARRWSKGKFVVAGPRYPQYNWPANVTRVEHVGPDEHVRFYRSLRFTLNVTRADMIARGYSPSVRLFEAAACAVPVVSDAWAGIEEFFEPGREILLAEHPEQVLTALRNMPEAERIEIGSRARARVLAQHTSQHRARQLEHYIVELRNGCATNLRALEGTGRQRRQGESPAAIQRARQRSHESAT
ncbi:MAG TPA: glycosyltransferase [Polyangiaceae bacterium]